MNAAAIIDIRSLGPSVLKVSLNVPQPESFACCLK